MKFLLKNVQSKNHMRIKVSPPLLHRAKAQILPEIGTHKKPPKNSIIEITFHHNTVPLLKFLFFRFQRAIIDMSPAF